LNLVVIRDEGTHRASLHQTAVSRAFSRSFANNSADASAGHRVYALEDAAEQREAVMKTNLDAASAGVGTSASSVALKLSTVMRVPRTTGSPSITLGLTSMRSVTVTICLPCDFGSFPNHVSTSSTPSLKVSQQAGSLFASFNHRWILRVRLRSLLQ
jgi:D-serine deaminase-like pyridoxal phosphate-dependent protein